MKLAPASLRGRITLSAVAVVGTVLAIAAVLIFMIQRGQLVQNIDNSLDRDAGQIVARLNDDASAVLGDRSDDRFVQLLRADGSILAGSSALLRQTAALDVSTADLDEDGLLFVTAAGLPIEDDHYRILVRQAIIRGEPAIAIVGENTDDLDDSLRALGISLAVLTPLAMALLGAVAWLVVGRTLAPVAEIQQEVSRISGGQLGDRVPVPDTSDEIADLATTMNAMLDRIDDAYARQQGFVADASHELRSPITRLRTSLEVDLAAPDRDLNETGVELLADVDDLQTLVDDLLFLAKAGHRSSVAPRTVDIDAVIDRVVGQLAPASGLVDTSNVRAVEVTGNEVHLTRLVTNLLSNAIRHADSQVWVVTEESAKGVHLMVHDDGPGIAPRDRERVFERFTRLDESRTASTGGSGLGLAIAADIVGSHGGTITAAQSPHGGALFTVWLAAARPA